MRNEKFDKLYAIYKEKFINHEITEAQFDVAIITGLHAFCTITEDTDDVITERRHDSANGMHRANIVAQSVNRASRKISKENALRDIINKAKKSMGMNSKSIKLDKPKAKIIRKLERRIRDEQNLHKYQSLFRQFIRLFGCNSNGPLDIRSVKYDTSDNDSSTKITLNYSTTEGRMQIPEGFSLYHSSTRKLTGDRLYPSFKGKSMGSDGKPKMNGGGELYSAPRIYFSLRETINPILSATSGASERFLYRAIDPPSTIYPDPHVPKILAYSQAAIFVETTMPISVVEVHKDYEVSYKKNNKKAIVGAAIAGAAIGAGAAAIATKSSKNNGEEKQVKESVNDSITLQEVMDDIDKYLSEKANNLV